VYFAGGADVIVTGRLNLTGGSNTYVVVRSTWSGIAARLSAPANHSVSYVDVQDKLPAELARVEIVVEGGPEATDMLQACRRWCITHPNRLGFRV
jgi:hypothetical protein